MKSSAADLPDDRQHSWRVRRCSTLRTISQRRSLRRLENSTELDGGGGSDRTISPELERWYAERAKSHTVEVAGASHLKIFRHSGTTVAFKTTFEVFTSIGPDNPLERLTERSVGLVTDQPSDVYELFVTPIE